MPSETETIECLTVERDEAERLADSRHMLLRLLFMATLHGEKQAPDSKEESGEALAYCSSRTDEEVANRLVRCLTLLRRVLAQREAAREWVRGNLSEAGDPANKKTACLWCGRIVAGRKEIDEHVASCPNNPLVVERDQLREQVRRYERLTKDCSGFTVGDFVLYRILGRWRVSSELGVLKTFDTPLAALAAVEEREQTINQKGGA